jgi:hypothetical protein
MISGVAKIKRGAEITLPYNPQTWQETDYLQVSFENDKIRLQVIFGGEDRKIVSWLRYCELRFSWYDLPKGVPIGMEYQSDRDRLDCPKEIQADLMERREILIQNLESILKCNENWFNEIQNRRNAHFENEIRQQFERGLNYASHKAAQAWFDRDYKRVIEFLRPYEGHLSSTDVRKLELAVKKMLGMQ